MAIDTEDKRMSMLSWHGSRRIPQPDGSIDQNDKQQLMGRYGGILFGSITIASGGQSINDLTIIFRD